MTKNETLYNSLTSLILYPDKDYKNRLIAAQKVLHALSPAPLDKLDAFIDFVLEQRETDLEEFYAQTFDFNPKCALEIGWHLYGENYGRGDFLVKMRDLLKRYDIQESTELPDHLMYILPVIGRLKESEAREFALHYVIPGLDKILEGVAAKKSPYENVLQFIQQVLKENYRPICGVNHHE